MDEELPKATVSKWGYVVLDYIGLGFILIGPEEWVRGVSVGACLTYVAAGAMFLFLGIMGPKIKEKAHASASNLSTLLIAVMFVTCLVVGYDLYDRHSTHADKFNSAYVPERVVGKTFTNETVILDGKEFYYCTFENTTLQYLGTTAIKMDHNNFIGVTGLSAGSPSVWAAFALIKGMGAARGIPVYNGKKGLDTPQISDPPVVRQ